MLKLIQAITQNAQTIARTNGLRLAFAPITSEADAEIDFLRPDGTSAAHIQIGDAHASVNRWTDAKGGGVVFGASRTRLNDLMRDLRKALQEN